MGRRGGNSKGDRQKADGEKRAVALSSLAAALVLTVLKVVVGMATHSLGILAEAAHSALDLVAAGITYWAVRLAGKPADADHTYGHGKFENLSALVETLLLLATCLWIFSEAGNRLWLDARVPVQANAWAFLVIGISIAVDLSRSRALKQAAQKHRSQALAADALHFSTDVWSSGVVLVGLVGVASADRLGMPWLEKADAVAAVAVALIVVSISLRLGKKSVDDLLDRTPAGLREAVIQAAAAVPGVEKVTQVRLRRSGPEVFADVTLAVDRASGFEGSHQVADRAEEAIRQVVPQADVVVHVEPVAAVGEEASTTLRVLARRHGLAAHGIRLYEQAGRRSVELHLEVDQTLDLETAHRQATRFEQAVRRVFPEWDRIATHIEPQGDAAAMQPTEPAGEEEIRSAIAEFARAQHILIEPHDLIVQTTGGQLNASFHCTLEATTKITDAHELTVRLEEHLRHRIPGLGRVLIHVEPKETGEA